MEKEFIPYEQALALKELGFDEPCFATIDQTDYLHINGTKKLPRGSMMYDTIDCPTFSQAFRWFREKHGLRHNIFEIGDKNKISGSIKGTRKNNFKHYGFINFYDTDEEAELECLKKLIEIVKQK